MTDCSEALAHGAVILTADQWLLLYGLLLAALSTAVSRLLFDAIERNGPPKR